MSTIYMIVLMIEVTIIRFLNYIHKGFEFHIKCINILVKQLSNKRKQRKSICKKKLMKIKLQPLESSI